MKLPYSAYDGEIRVEVSEAIEMQITNFDQGQISISLPD